MIAGVAFLLGLELHPNMSGNMEDDLFVNLGRRRNLKPAQVQTRIDKGKERLLPNEYVGMSRASYNQLLLDVATTYNSESDVWGWKDPSAWKYLEDIIGRLRNPYVILVTRDPTAVATARQANVPNESPIVSLDSVFQRYFHYLAIIKEFEVPALIVSYERAKLHPDKLAEELADFLHLRLTPEALKQIEQYCSPNGGYLVLRT